MYLKTNLKVMFLTRDFDLLYSFGGFIVDFNVNCYRITMVINLEQNDNSFILIINGGTNVFEQP